jgi:hypothetical protein
VIFDRVYTATRGDNPDGVAAEGDSAHAKSAVAKSRGTRSVRGD